MPVPRCGSRIDRRRRRRPAARGELESSGVRHRVAGDEQRLAAARFGRASRRSRAGSNASGVTGGTAAPVCAAALREATSPPSSSVVGRQPRESRRRRSRANGSASAIAPAGLPTRQHDVARRCPGPSARPRAGPSRPRTDQQHERDDERRRSRRARGSGAGRARAKRFIRLSSVGLSSSEAEVDERRDALAGHGRADEQDQDGEPDAEHDRPEALDAASAAARAACSGSSCRPITTTIASDDRRASTASPRPARTGAREARPRGRGSGERNRIHAEHDQVEGDDQRSHRRRAHAAASACSSDQAGAVEGAPQHERPRRPVPEPAEQHREHQVAVGLPRPPRLPPSGM